MSADNFNDALDNLFAGDIGPVGEPKPYVPARAVPVYKTAVERFEEGCDKCKGSGKFISYSGRVVGECFACKGLGKKVFKTSSATRATARNKSAERKAATVAADLQAFREREPDVMAWIVAECSKAKPFEFAVAMAEAISKYGDLTDRQLDTCKRLAAKASQPRADAPSIDVAGIDRLKASFDAAVSYSAAKGLKLSPRITIDGLTISPAKAHSANPGALYVKAGTEYLGKIAQGRFYAVAACTPADTAKVQAFVANPQEAAKVYGQTTGTCCICNATLRSEWKLRGIGPICAEKFGWA